MLLNYILRIVTVKMLLNYILRISVCAIRSFWFGIWLQLAISI